MPYCLIFKPGAQKQFRKLTLQQQKKIGQGLEYLKADPFVGKKLRGDLKGQYSLRVWPYIIIYQIIKKN